MMVVSILNEINRIIHGSGFKLKNSIGGRELIQKDLIPSFRTSSGASKLTSVYLRENDLLRAGRESKIVDDVL